MKSIIKTHPLLKIINGALIDLPSPRRIRNWWNFGSILGLCLIVQLLSGIFLAIHYTPDTYSAFESVNHISRNVILGWILRIIHANGARLFFLCLYIHTARGIYYSSFYFIITWSVGVVLLLLVIATAFLGYVLPWGQISFWGATVITNLFSAIPVIGIDVVYWLWGGFAVDKPTLTRFFTFHFLIPFIISIIVIIHLLFLHQSGSNNPSGLPLNSDKIPFHPYFSIKDLLGFSIVILFFGWLVLCHPWALGDPENFIPANPLVTPIHIQPEWYFLFAYAILRSIPNKLGGVIALVFSILILFTLPFGEKPKSKTIGIYIINKFLFWMLVNLMIILTWIGARPVEDPYILTGQVLRTIYFVLFFVYRKTKNFTDSLID